MNHDLTHISLFTGIGGFDLAASWAGFRTIAMCEIDQFCQEVLAARFGAVIANSEAAGREARCGYGMGDGKSDEQLRPSCCDIGTYILSATPPWEDKARFGSVADTGGARAGEQGANLYRWELSPSIGDERLRDVPDAEDRGPLLIPDIRDFDGTRFRGATLLTGGFPCQPFSHAGKRRGTSDDRHLWPEMLRVIKEAQPTYVLGENVSGIRSLEIGQGDADVEGDTADEPGGEDEYTIVLDGVCRDLEGIGYEVQPLIIPACAVNAPHRRDRVWICARRIDKDPVHDRGGIGEPQEQGRERDERDTLTGDGKRIHRAQTTAPAHSKEFGTRGGQGAVRQAERRQDDGVLSRPVNADSDAPDAYRGRCRQCHESIGPVPESATGDSQPHPHTQQVRLQCAGTQDSIREAQGVSSGEGGQSPDAAQDAGVPSTQPAGNNWDIPWIEVATDLLRMDDGLSCRMDEYLQGVENAPAIKSLSRQDVRVLREALQQEEIRNTFGRLWKISDPPFLLNLMLRIEAFSNGSGDILQTRPRVQESLLRPLWEQAKSGCASREWRHSEQHRREHEDALPFLPYEVALEIKEAWGCVRRTQEAISGRRVARLKALGNAIVPQVANEIIRNIAIIERGKP